jgi:hypothetical protein
MSQGHGDRERGRRARAAVALAALSLLGAWGCLDSKPKPAARDVNGRGPGALPGTEASSDMLPSDAIGGQSGEGGQPPPLQCVAELRTRLDVRSTFAKCTQRGTDSFHCDCDSDRSCGGSDSDGGADDIGCPFDIAASTCDGALREGCGLASGQNGFCEVRSGEHRVACFELPAGGHECHCPDQAEPTVSTEQDCGSALVRACASDCENDTGRCVFGADGLYGCECAVGIAGAAAVPLCEEALQSWCEPACASGRGACYWLPDGTRIPRQLPGRDTELACRCEGSTELHVSTPNNDVLPGPNGPPPPLTNPSAECNAQLERDCGS